MRRAEWAASCDDREPAFEVAIERYAIVQQIVDTRAGLARQPEGDRLVDQAGAGGDRIGGMRLGAVAFGNGGRDAALRPRRRRALAERSRRNHRHRARREFQGAKQPGKAGADDDDVARVTDSIMIPVWHARLHLLVAPHMQDGLISSSG